MISAVDWLALIVPEFTSVICPFPRLPAPCIVPALVSVSAVTAPSTKFALLFDSVTVLPLSVTFPCNTIAVPKVVPFTCTVPSCEYVPASRSSCAPLSSLKVPPAELLIVPPSVLTPLTSSIVPVALLVSVLPAWIAPVFICNVDAPVSVTVPPLIVELFTCSVLPLAEIVPPVLVNVVLCNRNVPPAVASSVPVLVATAPDPS